MLHHKRGFTLVELIVVITILAILATIGYISFIGYQVIARDAIRTSDVTNIAKVAELYRLRESSYPSVSGMVNITFSGATIWQQGIFGEESYTDAKRISQVPRDPLTKSNYMYSKTNETLEYQVGGILEKTGSYFFASLGGDTYAVEAQENKKEFAANIVKGNYNGKFIIHTRGDLFYVLGVPSILANTIEDVELNYLIENNLFIHEGKKVIPPSYSGALSEVGVGWTFDPTQSQDAIDAGYSGIIYIGDKDDLDSFDGKRDLVTNLKNYYNSTDALKSSDLLNIVDITNENNAVDIANTYIEGETGGFGATEIEKSALNENEYSWVSDAWGVCDATPTWSAWSGWSACTVSCGGGTQDRTRSCMDETGDQTRTVTCQRADGSIVADSNCSGTKPVGIQSCTETCTGNNSETQACNTQACYTYSWDIGSWGACDATPTWTAWSGWSGCSASCGGGTQSRSRSCTNTGGSETRSVTCLRSDGATVADAFCTTTKPTTTQACSSSCSGSAVDSQSCNTHSCYTYSWYVGAWSTCSTGTAPGSWGSCNCSTGTRSRPIYSTPGSQSRTVFCQRSDGAGVSDAYCGGGKPSSSQTCGGGAIINTEFGSCTCPCPGSLLASCSEYYCPSTGGMTCGPATGCPSTWVNTGASCPSYCSGVQTSPTTWHCQ